MLFRTLDAGESPAAKWPSIIHHRLWVSSRSGLQRQSTQISSVSLLWISLSVIYDFRVVSNYNHQLLLYNHYYYVNYTCTALYEQSCLLHCNGTYLQQYTSVILACFVVGLYGRSSHLQLWHESFSLAKCMCLWAGPFTKFLTQIFIHLLAIAINRTSKLGPSKSLLRPSQSTRSLSRLLSALCFFYYVSKNSGHSNLTGVLQYTIQHSAKF